MNAYETWQKAPSPDALGEVLKEYDPVITAETTRYGGGPIMKSKARELAVTAIKNYDPAKGSQLSSWIVTQLQPLARYKQQQRPLRLPEAASRRAAEVNRLQQELSDELGRHPSDEELADKAGINVKRLQQLRNMSHAVATESSVARIDADSDTVSLPGIDAPESLADAAETVYADLDPRSQLVYDYTLGRHGRPALSKVQIAAKLGVTPAFISQQSANIARQIQTAQTLLS